MELQIRNINKIKSADVQLNGLTIIVGENDSGKSTIGRILFSTIKALVNTKANNEQEKEDLLRKHVASLYSRLSGIKRLVTPTSSIDNVTSSFPRNMNEFLKKINEEKEAIDEYINTLISSIDELKTTPRMKSLMKNDLRNIKICMNGKDNRAAGVYTEFQYLLESEFLNQFYGENNTDVSIKLIADDKKTSLFHYYTNDKGGDVQCQCRTEDFLEDVTYVESPLYMHMLDSLMYASAYREIDKRYRNFRPMIPYHIKDFVEKMNASHSHIGQPKHNTDTIRITGGKFSYDNTKNAIVFTKEGLTILPLNTASGIKSFGVLQLLLDGDFIDTNRPLIWDEPENHLHPEWQVEFAKILVQLYQSGIPIVITTHSPYFLQAVRYYTAKEKIEDYVTYYMAQSTEEGFVTMENVTENLNKVFVKLAAPLNAIMNVDAARQGIEI